MFRWFMVLCFCLSSQMSWAFDILDMETLPDTKTVFVGNMVQNGTPVQIMQFSSNLSVLEVLSFYKKEWSDNRKVKNNTPKMIEKKVAEWTNLSKLEGAYSVVVQVKVKQYGGSEGFISVLDLRRPAKISKKSKQFPRIGGTKMVSTTESKDGGRSAVTMVLFNTYSVDSNDAFYRAKMTSEGWQLVRGFVKEGVVALLFNKQGQQCEMTISSSDQGDSVIMVNIVENAES